MQMVCVCMCEVHNVRHKSISHIYFSSVIHQVANFVRANVSGVTSLRNNVHVVRTRIHKIIEKQMADNRQKRTVTNYIAAEKHRRRKETNSTRYFIQIVFEEAREWRPSIQPTQGDCFRSENRTKFKMPSPRITNNFVCANVWWLAADGLFRLRKQHCTAIIEHLPLMWIKWCLYRFDAWFKTSRPSTLWEFAGNI